MPHGKLWYDTLKSIKYYLSVLESDREMTLSIFVKYNLYVK